MPTDGNTDRHDEAYLGAFHDYANAPQTDNISHLLRTKSEEEFFCYNNKLFKIILYVEALAMLQACSRYPVQRPRLLSDSVMTIVQ